MNIKERILKMDKYLVDHNYIDEDTYVEKIEDLLLTVETRDYVYELCSYICEDSIWATFIILSIGNGQCMTIRKDEIVSFGIYNGADPFAQKPKTDKKIYQ